MTFNIRAVDRAAKFDDENAKNRIQLLKDMLNYNGLSKMSNQANYN